jgi:hypothetical protein
MGTGSSDVDDNMIALAFGAFLHIANSIWSAAGGACFALQASRGTNDRLGFAFIDALMNLKKHM